jgi:hypothetical protein
VGERFSPAIARWFDTHQPGIQLVLHVAAKDSVFDQNCILAGLSFIIYGK